MSINAKRAGLFVVAAMLVGASLFPSSSRVARAQSVNTREVQQQGGDEVEQVDTSLTTLLLTAADKKGRLVNTLRAEDVRVFEDGAEQRVTTFERQTQRPLSLARARLRHERLAVAHASRPEESRAALPTQNFPSR